ncbi:MAG TPA: transglycosylase domain-containing protein [Candidatus Paceibacterota bacterium]
MHPMWRKKRRRGSWFWIWTTSLLVGFIAAVISAVYLFVVYKTLPSVEEIETRRVPQSTRIYDREHKVVLYEISGSEKRIVVPFGEISQHLKDATVSIEDQNFYEGPAFDWRGIVRAVWVNLKQGRIAQGGSTITQQLARNAFLTLDKTIARKIKELLLAIRLSRHYTKDQILGLYLNEIPYGPTIYGAGKASSVYFNKENKDLTIAESAILAAIPKAPSYYSPWGIHTKELMARQRVILKKMFDLGKISKEEYEAALSEKTEFAIQNTGLKAPHFAMMVQDYLVKTYGEDLVRTGGLDVTTTLNWDVQQAAEEAVVTGAERNEKLYQGKNAALVAQDPKTGQILALVGSKDYFDIANEGNFNVATQGLRQPGSALKPFIYLTAFSLGYTPQTTIFDTATEFRISDRCPTIPDLDAPNDYCFHPQDFDGYFRGPVEMRQALAWSLNIPAVKTLYLVGIPNALKTLNTFGLTTLNDPSRYGLSLVLGGGEIRLVDLVGAYSVLAADGIKHNQSVVMEVKDSNGTILESYQDSSNQVFDQNLVRHVNKILSNTELRAGLLQGSIGLTIFPGHQLALKTGTTNDYRDAWAMGYTPNLAVGVWAGNNNNAPMQKKGSSLLAAIPMWHDFLSKIINNVPVGDFVEPVQLIRENPVLNGDFSPDGQIHSLLFYIDKNNPLGPKPENPNKDPQFNNWESAVLDWAGKNGFSPPVKASQIDVKINQPTVGLELSEPIAPLSVSITAQNQIKEVVVLINGVVAQTNQPNQTNNYEINQGLNLPGNQAQNQITVRVEDVLGLKNESSVIVYVKNQSGF